MKHVVEISGSSHVDARGKLIFFNTFDMGQIVRFYSIEPSSVNVVRAWQGHKLEKKWFYCTAGSFVINLVKVDDFEHPSKQLNVERFVVSAAEPKILALPKGYANGFKALVEGSKLMVFSNASLTESQQDDYRYSIEQWAAQW
ncbi:MAG: hypothetical protein WBM83_11030 [Flavobacteriaceae bacterium]